MPRFKPQAKRNNAITFDTWLIKAVHEHVEQSTDFNKLSQKLMGQMPKHLARTHRTITRRALLNAIDDVCFKDHKELLAKAVKTDRSPERLYELLKEQHSEGHGVLPPLWVLAWKLSEMHGRTVAPRADLADLGGVLRQPFHDAPAVELPMTSFEKPLHLLEMCPRKPKVLVISAPQVGLAFAEDIKENTTRCGFAYGRRNDYDAVILSGPLLGGINAIKTVGSSRLARDVISGIEIKIASLAEYYREEAAEKLKPSVFEPVFVTAEEILNEAMRGFFKVTNRPDGEPDRKKTPYEFPGPVFVILNQLDLEFVQTMAYFEILPKMFKRLREAMDEVSLANTVKKEAMKHLAQMRRTGTRREIKAAEARLNTAKQRLVNALKLQARIRMTNLYPRKNIAFYAKARDYLIQLIEKHIPNAKVIGQNGVYTRFGTDADITKFVSAKNANVHRRECEDFGKEQRQGHLPALTVSMHSGAIKMRKVSRENYLLGKPNKTVSFVEAPILVDKNALLKAMDGISPNLPVVKAVNDSRFCAGALSINYDSRFDIPDAEPVSDIAILKAGIQVKGYTPPRRIWMLHQSDIHSGGANQVWVYDADGMPWTLEAAAMHMMKWYVRTHKVAPVHMSLIEDDLTQGNHFGTHLRPHHLRITNAKVLQRVRERFAEIKNVTDQKVQLEMSRKVITFLCEQIRVRPSDHLGTQFEEFADDILWPNREVYGGIIRRAHHSGVVVRGIAEILGTEGDSRSLGIINFGSGNHATATAKETLYEGPNFRQLLQASFRYDQRYEKIYHDHLIQSPVFQDSSIGYGHLQADGGYTWGLHVCGTPPMRKNWYDLVEGWIDIERRRGNPSGILDGMSVLNFCGDKHFFSFSVAGSDYYLMSPSGTHTDAYAYKAGGLPENTPGVAFCGVPVGGPSDGDVIAKHLPQSVIQRYLLSGENFPWDEFLPNAI
ncbi:hypothetical protein HZC00_00665 [Candidatus Kaiserbacteria bacterium]|nr:hypothetical protein [Candidatus Kaiserbacteria bacterium]